MRGAILLSSLILLTSVAAQADPTRDEVMSGAARCAGIADNRVWLDCFYGSAQPMRSILGLSPAPATQLRLVPPPGAAYTRPDAPPAYAPPPPRQKSGGFLAGLLGSVEPVVTNMPMASYRIGANRLFTVTLQNGQIYQQEEGDMTYAKWSRPPASYLVTIVPYADKFVLRVKSERGISFHVIRR